MTPLQQLDEIIALEADRLRASVPPDREAAILALLHLIDQQPSEPTTPQPDLLTGQQIANRGGNLALRLCLDRVQVKGARTLTESWAEHFLSSCHRLADIAIVRMHCETGYMRLFAHTDGSLDAWIASKRPSPRWQERADIAWWSSSLARDTLPELTRLQARAADQDMPVDIRIDTLRQLAHTYLRRMAWQLSYPPDAIVGDVHIQMCLDVLKWLIAHALQARSETDVPTVMDSDALAHTLSRDLDLPRDTVGKALSLLTLDRDNADWHSAVPGITAAPLVRIAPDRVALSTYGLLTQPILFMMRDLRRRNEREYHNAAHYREDVFRQDIAALFPDKRFTVSSGRVALHRERGTLRTDIDAVVFDRKTGTMGVFELKSQDPLARSAAEQERQRDNILYANKQISGVLAFIQKYGGDEILSRMDRAASKRFRVQKVYAFVLGRYIVHFNDGPVPDRRAAWATWPQVLRIIDGQPLRSIGLNPIATLHSRLSTDPPAVRPEPELPKRTIEVAGTRLTVWASYAGARTSTEA